MVYWTGAGLAEDSLSAPLANPSTQLAQVPSTENRFFPKKTGNEVRQVDGRQDKTGKPSRFGSSSLPPAKYFRLYGHKRRGGVARGSNLPPGGAGCAKSLKTTGTAGERGGPVRRTQTAVRLRRRRASRVGLVRVSSRWTVSRKGALCAQVQCGCVWVQQRVKPRGLYSGCPLRNFGSAQVFCVCLLYTSDAADE